ncbi:RDD family protein [Streptomyces sp. NPDC053750]|uniref:RDD family protein n=1 Tax=Streptomyces sp. NPDC053750 TaxID=3365714 RepID=UPI0037D5C072
MSAPTPAPGDDRPREGYYPDPSIPGYVRYWNGASWVPGTSRPAPKDGEPLAPPPGARPSVEETGPHFFDEDPVEEPPPAESQHGSRPEPASAWGADRAHQSGFGDDQNRRVAWPGAAAGTDPRVPHARGAADEAAPADGGAVDAGAGAGAGAGSGAGTAGVGTPGDPRAGGARGAGVGGAGGGSGHPGSGSGGAGAPSGARAGVAGGSGRPGPDAGGASGAGTAGAGGGSAPAQGDGARAARADGAAGTASGETEAASGNTFVFRRPTAGAAQGAGASGPDGATAEDEGTITFRAVSPRPGFGAGKAAAARAAAQPPAAGAPTALSGPQQVGGASGPGVPHQAAAPQPVASPQQPAAPAPVAAGPGGGQSSWAQQVHRLADAGGEEQPVAPWKPPVEDVFQAAARRQAAARPAGLGKRLAARLIDTVVLAGVTAVAAVPLGTKAIDHVNGKIDEAKLSGETVTVWLLDGTTGTYLGIVLAVLLLFGVVYEALPTAKWGRTLGKKLLGLEVRDIEAHEPPAFGVSLRRWLVYSVPGLLAVGVVGIAWCLFDRPWHQCWHDKAAGTFVAG